MLVMFWYVCPLDTSYSSSHRTNITIVCVCRAAELCQLTYQVGERRKIRQLLRQLHAAGKFISWLFPLTTISCLQIPALRGSLLAFILLADLPCQWHSLSHNDIGAAILAVLTDAHSDAQPCYWQRAYGCCYNQICSVQAKVHSMEPAKVQFCHQWLRNRYPEQLSTIQQRQQVRWQRVVRSLVDGPIYHCLHRSCVSAMVNLLASNPFRY